MYAQPWSLFSNQTKGQKGEIQSYINEIISICYLFQIKKKAPYHPSFLSYLLGALS